MEIDHFACVSQNVVAEGDKGVNPIPLSFGPLLHGLRNGINRIFDQFVSFHIPSVSKCWVARNYTRRSRSILRNMAEPIKTIDLVRAYLKTKQRRYRILTATDGGGLYYADPPDALHIYRGHTKICTLTFGDDTIVKCYLMEGVRTIDLHDPTCFTQLFILFECFEWLLAKMVDGEFDPVDIPLVLRNDTMWDLLIKGAIADNPDYVPTELKE